MNWYLAKPTCSLKCLSLHSLPHNDLPSYAKALACILQLNTSLEWLSVECPYLSPKDYQCMIRAMTHNQTLKTLRFKGIECSLGYREEWDQTDTDVWRRMLETNTTLEELKVAYFPGRRGLDTTGLCSILHGLATNKSLTQLSIITGCDIHSTSEWDNSYPLQDLSTAIGTAFGKGGCNVTRM